MIERAFERVPAAELYATTGIQTLAINTVFQLRADEGSPALAAAEGIALVPDLLGAGSPARWSTRAPPLPRPGCSTRAPAVGRST